MARMNEDTIRARGQLVERLIEKMIVEGWSHVDVAHRIKEDPSTTKQWVDGESTPTGVRVDKIRYLLGEIPELPLDESKPEPEPESKPTVDDWLRRAITEAAETAPRSKLLAAMQSLS